MRTRRSRSGLFLLELTLVIFFFSLTAAIYVQLFVKAHTIAEESVDLTEGTLRAQNLAEVFYATGTDADAIAATFPDGALSTSGAETAFIQYFDAVWEVLPADRGAVASFTVGVTYARDGDLVRGAITVTATGTDTDPPKEEKVLYTLPLLYYLPESGGGVVR